MVAQAEETINHGGHGDNSSRCDRSSSRRVLYEQRSWKRFGERMMYIISLLGIVFFSGLSGSYGFQTLAPLHQRHVDSQSAFSAKYDFHCTIQRSSVTFRLYAKAVKLSNEPWYPLLEGDQKADVELQAVELCSQLIRRQLDGETELAKEDEISSRRHLIRGRFMDLTCSRRGEETLEALFNDNIVNGVEEDVIRASAMVIQSLCVFGTQVGVKGTPEQLLKQVAHLDARRDPSLLDRDVYCWDADSVRRLKHRLDREPAVQLLANLQWKRTTQGAFDLLNALKAWTVHEDLALLRSGFPLRFSESEELSAKEATMSERDPEDILGIRKDLRHLKVYTVDSASTSDIDDGLSVEKVENPDGSIRYRVWVHIADAEKWAPRSSEVYAMAQKRITSLYLPRRTIPMFPMELTDTMSLKSNADNFALSLAAEINEDGSLDKSSIFVVPSLIRITYRLTYEEVDEMLEEGTGYREEWQLGVLLDLARKRRDYRVSRGSAESLIPNPIPYNTISTFRDDTAADGIGIKIRVEVSHNAGLNQTVETALNDPNTPKETEIVPVSSSFLLVTEAMILAGEAVGHWKIRLDREVFRSLEDNEDAISNRMRLPFRTQPKPDFKSRARERRMMEDLRDSNVGNGYCFAWYARRFLLPVKISEHSFPHSGLGLDCYVQWTSPIRRFSDLQTHVSVKRSLRRQRLSELLQTKREIPSGLLPVDFGFPFDSWPEDISDLFRLASDDLDEDLNFLQGIGLMGAARTLQRQSQRYWLYEFIKRNHDSQPDLVYMAVVLGCVDPERQQYAVYLPALGLEHRYTSPCRLDPGTRLRLSVESVYPRLGLLSFVRTV